MSQEFSSQLLAPLVRNFFSTLVLRDVKLVNVVAELVKKQIAEYRVASEAKAQPGAAPLFFKVVEEECDSGRFTLPSLGVVAERLAKSDPAIASSRPPIPLLPREGPHVGEHYGV